MSFAFSGNAPDPVLVPVDQIDDRNRLRPVSPTGVAAIVESMRELGVMKDPIHVRKKGDKMVLIAGGHRLQAHREQGLTEIRAVVWTKVTDDWARLMEIDDNLAGGGMTVLDTAVFLAERKRVYEKLHPEAKAATGGALVAKRWNTADMMSVVSFAAATAETLGVSERHVRRLVEAGERLGVDAARLRRAPLPVTLKDLTEIAKLSETVARYNVIDALVEGRAKTAAEAKRMVDRKGEVEAPKDPVEEGFKALLNAWSRAPAAARRRFVDEQREALVEMLEGGAA